MKRINFKGSSLFRVGRWWAAEFLLGFNTTTAVIPRFKSYFDDRKPTGRFAIGSKILPFMSRPMLHIWKLEARLSLWAWSMTGTANIPHFPHEAARNHFKLVTIHPHIIIKLSSLLYNRLHRKSNIVKHQQSHQTKWHDFGNFNLKNLLKLPDKKFFTPFVFYEIIHKNLFRYSIYYISRIKINNTAWYSFCASISQP